MKYVLIRLHSISITRLYSFVWLYLNMWTTKSHKVQCRFNRFKLKGRFSSKVPISVHVCVWMRDVYIKYVQVEKVTLTIHVCNFFHYDMHA